MSVSPDAIRAAVRGLMPEAQDFLSHLIALPTPPGKETELMLFAERAAQRLDLEVERVPLSNALRNDEDYSSPVPGIDYTGRFNLRLRRPGSGGGKRLLFNSHTDAVPPSAGQVKPFEPQVKDGVIYGRGACDAKGQVTTIYLTLAALRQLGVKLRGDVLAHVVVEEEVGGNGTMAMARRGEQADACVVLEPTTNRVFTSVRGAVWFRMTCTGKPGHSGRAGDTISALTIARRCMERLEKFHAELLANSRGIPLFDKFPNPMPLTFGQCHAGDWPATAPARAVVEGVLGFLPNRNRRQIMDEFRAAAVAGDAQAAERVSIEFTYRHDCHVLPPEHPLPTQLLATGQAWGLPVTIDAMTASCDSWFYNNQLGIPTVVYGPGTLAYAHSNEEQLALADLEAAAGVLTAFACQWCE